MISKKSPGAPLPDERLARRARVVFGIVVLLFVAGFVLAVLSTEYIWAAILAEVE
jgi:hypothetical protein